MLSVQSIPCPSSDMECLLIGELRYFQSRPMLKSPPTTPVLAQRHNVPLVMQFASNRSYLQNQDAAIYSVKIVLRRETTGSRARPQRPRRGSSNNCRCLLRVGICGPLSVLFAII